MSGKLIVNTGGMYSGKTSALIQQTERYQIAGKKTIFLKPKKDNRYCEDRVVSHGGLNKYATLIDENECLNIEELNEYDVIAIDEVQFFDLKIIKDIDELINKKGKIVIVSGLDMDFLGEGFEVVMNLMAKADEVHKHKAICDLCKQDSVFSFRTVKDENRVLIGEKKAYIPLCRSCYNLHMDFINLRKESEKKTYVF